MAKNWTAAEAVAAIVEGKDKEAIQDIGKRFPLFAHNAAKGQEGLQTIIAALSEKISARTIEAKLKEGVEESTEEDVEEVEETKAAPKGRGKKAAETKAPAKGRGKKAAEPEEDEEEEEEKPKRGAKGKAAAGAGKGRGKKAPEPEEEDEDLEEFDEDEDVFEDEEEDGLEELSLAELKALAKTNKISIKGCKSSDDIIEKLRAKGIVAPDDEEEDEDGDEWDI